MLSLINGDTGSGKGPVRGKGKGSNGYEGSFNFVKGVFTYVSTDDNHVKNTITMINSTYLSERIRRINIYLKGLANSGDGSNNIDLTIYQLDSIKNLVSQFSGHIANYNTRIKSILIPRLSRLVTSEYTIKQLASLGKGNGIKSKYEEIIGQVQSVVRKYNQNLETRFKKFKNKIEKHKKSLETNIKKYIFYIRFDLSYVILPVISKLISDIKNNIKSLVENNSNLNKFDKYNSKEELKKWCIELKNDDETHFKEIYDTHEEYKKLLTQSCSEITKKLNEFICDLSYYNYYINFINNSLCKHNDSVSDSSNIETGLNWLNCLKTTYLDKFGDYQSNVEKLEKIGKLITTMKDALKQVKGEVEKKAKNYIEKLSDININKEDVENITKIKEMNESAVARLNNAMHTIDFYNFLKDELAKLNGVTFKDYNFSEFLKNSLQIQKNLTSFDTSIKGAINKISTEINKINSNLFPKSYKDYYTNVYTSDIPKIINIINIISNFNKLECEIEGVARNFIHSTINNITECYCTTYT